MLHNDGEITILHNFISLLSISEVTNLFAVAGHFVTYQ